MSYTRKPGSMLYTPPEGYYDLPFIWTYNASKLTNGLAYPNQYVYLQGGYGDFIMRRVLGLSRVLNPSTGQYQIRDNANNYIEELPVYGVSADDIGIAPELRYQETGAIKFDLGIIDLPSVPSTGQICFEGVRRMKGNPPGNPTYQSRPKTFTYILTAPVNPPIGSFVTVRQWINNYDFELFQIILLSSSATAGAPYCYVGENGGVAFSNLTSSNVTLNITSTGVGASTVTVMGSTITVNQGVLALTITAFLNLWNATPAATALASAVASTIGTCGANTATPNTTPFYEGNVTGEILAPAAGSSSLGALTSPISSLVVYDSNKVAISNAPVVDIYLDGGPGGVYKNGALVPPLWYPKDSILQVDVYSQVASGNNMLAIYLVGRQHIPC
jgi:hypothetical protein